MMGAEIPTGITTRAALRLAEALGAEVRSVRRADEVLVHFAGQPMLRTSGPRKRRNACRKFIALLRRQVRRARSAA